MKNSNTEGCKGIWKRIGKWIGRTLFLLVETVLLDSGEKLLVESMRNY